MAMVEKIVPYEVNGRQFEGKLVYDDSVKGKRPMVYMQPDWKGIDADTTGQELSVEQSLRDHLGRTGKPVLFGFPFGHIAAPLTLPLNCHVRLDATLRVVTVLEPAVNPAPS